MWDPYAEFESVSLPNGLSVYVAHWPGRPWEAVSFLVHSGAEHDIVGREGLAHFVEHLVSENAGISNDDIRQFFAGNGGTISLGTTSYHATWYDFFLPLDGSLMKKAFDITGRMLLSSHLNKCVERERQVIIEEFNRAYPLKLNPNLKLIERERKALYSGHWLERFVRPLGKPESIRVITEDDLQRYYDTHYTPSNMSIVCVGGMSLSDIVDLLSNSPFAKKKEGARSPYPTPLIDLGYPTEAKYQNRMASIFKGVFSNTVRYRSVAKVPITGNGSTIGIVSEMLDKVLNQEIRKHRAWTYHIESYWCNYRYFFEFSIVCGALAIRARNEIEEVIENCITSLWSSENLLAEAKRNAFLRNTVVDLSGKAVRDGARINLAMLSEIRTLSEINHDIDRVTMKDVQEVLKLLTPDRRWTLIF